MDNTWRCTPSRVEMAARHRWIKYVLGAPSQDVGSSHASVTIGHVARVNRDVDGRPDLCE